MRIRIIAVGQHIADWAETAVRDYLGRFPRGFDVELNEIRTEPRAGQPPAKLIAAEGERICKAIGPEDYVIVLDEHGRNVSTLDFAKLIAKGRADGETYAFIIGGPDGLAPEVKALARETIRLSDMTLPHAFARVLLAEQLYRAWSILANHPYHRA